MSQIKICSVTNCEKLVKNRKDICEMHYYRMRRNGNYHHKKLSKTTRPIDFKEDENNCFIVTSHIAYSHGYFVTKINGIRKSVHRLVYEECFGEIPEGLVVRHKCDERNCVNPEHLELGTQGDNVMDAVRRNRTLRGVKHPQCKLNEAIVREIKSMLVKGVRNCEISKKMNLNKSTICNIKHGKSWSHIS